MIIVHPEHLQRMIAEDEFDLLKLIDKPPPLSAEERLMSAYQEIVGFVAEHGHEPKLDSADVAEIKLAMRLKAMASNEA